MKSNKLLTSILFIIVGFAVGMYVGYGQIAAETAPIELEHADIPDDVATKTDFSDFWEAWKQIEARHPDAAGIDDQEKVWGAIKGLVGSVGDPYSVFLTPDENEDLQTDLAGEFSGVGMEVGMKEDRITVIAPLKDSPAERAGLMTGDVLIKIDETYASNLSVDEAVDLIRGEEGTTVTITIVREGTDAPLEFPIVRAVIVVPDIETEYLAKDKVFVITFSSFGENSRKEFEKALEEFAASKSKKLIIDLRGNPGGYLSAAVDISSWFLPEGTIIVSENAPGESTEDHVFRAKGHFMKGDYKVAILVDGGSASASEIMAGALQQHDVARLVGEQTFGKGSVQELIPMSGGTALKLTIAEWLTPDGTNISKEGLTPDVEVKFDVERYKKDKFDNQLQKAIEILK